MSEKNAEYRPHVALSTSSLYPQGVPETFEAATRLGYDSVEVLVTHERMSQLTHQLLDSVQTYQLPISTIPAPTAQSRSCMPGRHKEAHAGSTSLPAQDQQKAQAVEH